MFKQHHHTWKLGLKKIGYLGDKILYFFKTLVLTKQTRLNFKQNY